VKTATGTIWYPGELLPHFLYIDGTLSGMAAAIPRTYEAAQQWEAFDMRHNETGREGPVALGQYNSVDLANQRVESVVLITRLQ
jgi:hypothetical protein